MHLRKFILDVLDNSLVVHALPDPVAGEDQELVAAAELPLFNIRQRDDKLLILGQA